MSLLINIVIASPLSLIIIHNHGISYSHTYKYVCIKITYQLLRKELELTWLALSEGERRQCEVEDEQVNKARAKLQLQAMIYCIISNFAGLSFRKFHEVVGLCVSSCLPVNTDE